jgi:hypothetical protein
MVSEQACPARIGSLGELAFETEHIFANGGKRVAQRVIWACERLRGFRR